MDTAAALSLVIALTVPFTVLGGVVVGLVKLVRSDGYGHRHPADSSDWSSSTFDLPSRPYGD